MYTTQIKLILVFLGFFSGSLYSQNKSIDSLERLLKHHKIDTSYIEIQLEICNYQFKESNLKAASKTAYTIISESKMIQYDYGVAQAENLLGVIYKDLGETAKAINYLLKAAKHFEKTNDNIGLLDVYNDIGTCFLRSDNPTMALKYFNLATRYNSEKNSKDLININSNIGIAYLIQKDMIKAEKHFSQAIKMSKAKKYDYGIAINSLNVSQVYFNNEEYQKALEFNETAFEISAKMKMASTMNSCELNFAQIYLHLDQPKLAKEHALNALKISLKSGEKMKTKNAYAFLSDIYFETGEFKSAAENLRKLIALKDEMYNEGLSQQIIESTEKYDSDRKDKLILHQNLKIYQNKLNQNKKQNQLVNLGLAFSIVLVFLGFTIYTVIKQKKVNRSLHEKNVEIAEIAFKNRRQEITIARYQSQMNPHFIFNALNGLQDSIWTNDKESATDQILTLSKLIRATLYNSEKESITLESEISYLKKYLNFELNRFKNKFDFHIEVAEELDIHDALIPPMLVQPIVENAIKHAHLNFFPDGEIKICFSTKFDQNNELLQIDVIDNGRGFVKEESMHISKGLEITQARIKMAFEVDNINNDNVFQIISPIDNSSDRPGTKITFNLPFKSKY